MKLLRTTSTRRLLAGLTGLLVAILAGTAIAIAASGSGPKPAPKPLARAVHDAMTAPAVAGITARITFTNHLIDAGNIQGTDPLFTGGSGRLWVSPGHGLRIELQSDNGDTQVVINKTMFWAYDPTSSTVYEGHIPADTSRPSSKPAGHGQAPSQRRSRWRGLTGLRRRPRRAVALRALRPWRQDARARAQGDRHLLWEGGRLGVLTHRATRRQGRQR
jgi:hypothetical protein